MQAHAYLGTESAHHVFKFNPSQVQWSYKQNTMSTDTIGGRVVQLLSVSVDGIQVGGVAGSRSELQKMAENVRAVMNYHIKTMRPVSFRVPSRRWDFKVYVTAMPQMGWDVAATAYPYSLQLAVDEDLTGVKVPEMQALALLRLYKGVGYDPAFHGGDPQGFDKIVKTVLAASQSTANGGSGDGAAPDLGGGSKGEAALKVALEFKGGQYYMGGFDAPGGGTISGGVGDPAKGTTDCSGLTEYAWRRGAGVEIGSTANCQLQGAKASGAFFNERNNLQAGDLMFYDMGGCSSTQASHVALWVSQSNGGQIFHAHTSGAPIEYSDASSYWGSWLGAARPEKNFHIPSGCACR